MGLKKEEKKKLEEEKQKVWLLSLEEVEQILNYEFNNKNLLNKAFTHPSYETKDSYERSGVLTNLRRANVDTEKLARVAVKHGLHPYLRHKAPDIENQVRAFSNDISNYPLHSNGLIETPKILADIVESTIGAVFIDSNYSLETVWMVFNILLEPIISPETLSIHPMAELNELCQKNKMNIDFVDGSTSETCRTFSVVWENKVIGTSTSTSATKEIVVKYRAAKAALDHLKATLHPAN